MDAPVVYIDYVPILQDNYIWLLIHPIAQKAIAIDPGDAAPLQDYLTLNKLSLEAILLTHHHADHTQGVEGLLQHYSVSVYGPDDIREVTNGVREPGPLLLACLDTPIQILHVPGHTLDHIAYYWEGHLFCGDTLFSAGCGRVFEGTMAQMTQSLQKLMTLPDETLIYCTHEYTLKNLEFAQLVEPGNSAIRQYYQQMILKRQSHQPTLPSTLKLEKAINPFLRCEMPDVIQSAEDYAGRRLNNSIDVFKILREWKNAF
jgi:hydroxyacylglutathione hydrolase